MNRITNFIRELQERRVFRIASVYAVTMWIIIQGAIDLFPVFGIPDWATRLLVVIAVIGFPIAIILAWAYQVTGEGVVRDEGHGGEARATRGWRVDFIVVGALVLLVAFIFLREQFTEVIDIDGAAAGDSAAVTVAEELHPQSIAVLPFVNMSSDEDTEYFSDGITEELLNVLANIPGLRVASRTSAFAFKGTQADIPTVSQKLGVAFVLEGSVRRSRDTVRITAQLIDAREDVHMWSETYDRELLEIFAIQDEISAVIVDRLKPTVLAARGAGTPPHSVSTTSDMKAYDLYLRGRSAYRPNDAEALRESMDFLAASLEADPEFARARSAMARSLLAYAEMTGEEDYRERAFVEARAALRRDNMLREAHEVLRAE
jgi:adenylate cyclase